MQFGLAQAKARLSELTSLVDSGHEVLIAKHGRPGYRLVPVSAVQASNIQTGVADTAPASLDDIADYLAAVRSKTRKPRGKSSFVAEWRTGARY